MPATSSAAHDSNTRKSKEVLVTFLELLGVQKEEQADNLLFVNFGARVRSFER